ncbi:hypothetical protein BDV93DRAFT_607343 [Ceratobasidium sp. AG-I]|nr:hypothetical protein BDV93DRAFT_607343 [Ceratobasidium sp. AG-I]
MIDQLPLDLVLHIFVLGANLDQQKRQRATDSWVGVPEFRDVITWVSREWRTIALSTSLLWAYIDLSDGTPYSRSARNIARSGDSQPLDIHLNINRRFLKGLHKGDYAGHTERTLEALVFLISNGGNTERWRTFSATTTAAIILDDIVGFLYNAPFPSLESFSLLDCCRSRVEYATPDGIERDADDRLSLFDTQPPQLRSVRIKAFDSIYTLDQSGTPIFSRLTSLELGLVGPSPPLSGMELLLTHNPHLQTLRLNLTQVKQDFEKRRTRHYDRINLNFLKELSLTNPHSPWWAQRLYQMINAPNLQHLRIYMHYCFEVFYIVVSTITTVQHNVQMFPALRHLSTNLRDTWLKDILLAYPEIEQLTLLSRHGPIAVSMLSHKPWLLPRLKRLRISDCPSDALCIIETARARMKGHIPLQSIEIKRMQFASCFFGEKMQELERMSGRTCWYDPTSDEDSGSDGYDDDTWSDLSETRRPRRHRLIQSH